MATRRVSFAIAVLTTFQSNPTIATAFCASASTEFVSHQFHCPCTASSRARKPISLSNPCFLTAIRAQNNPVIQTTTPDPSLSISLPTAIVPWNRSLLEEYASQQGVILSLTTLGPGYRALARAKHNSSLILGYVEGFVRPGGNKLLHLDKMEVFKPSILRSRTENPNEFQGGGTSLGVGLLLGYLCLIYAREEKNCNTAEFLAINDGDFQHKRLVRYYKISGFDVIKYVGDDWTDIPDRMVWGGCGTLLRKEIDFLLTKWTEIMVRSKDRNPGGKKRI